VLEVTNDGTNDLKRARKHALFQEYELFRLQQGETIANLQKRFTCNIPREYYLKINIKINNFIK